MPGLRNRKAIDRFFDGRRPKRVVEDQEPLQSLRRLSHQTMEGEES
jgi:hypothetical protein